MARMVGARQRRLARPGARRGVRLSDAGLVALGLATFLMVAHALDSAGPVSVAVADGARSPTPRAVPTASTSPGVAAGPRERAALAFAPGRSWRAVGAASCSSGGRPATLESSTDDGRIWAPTRTPLHWVAAVSTRRGLLVVAGATRSCAPAAASSRDEGRTWNPVVPGTSVPTLAAVDGALWFIDGSSTLRLGPSFAAAKPVAAAPCAGPDNGPASLVAGVGAKEALVVCQRPDGSGRLLVHTGDGGASWRRYAGKRVETGLAGGGRIVSLSMVEPGIGLALIRGTACGRGEVRLTSDGGTQWRTLSCATLPAVATVLAVGLQDQKRALLIGVTARGDLETWSSADAGATWAKVSPNA